jgi:hypothetical protein
MIMVQNRKEQNGAETIQISSKLAADRELRDMVESWRAAL